MDGLKPKPKFFLPRVKNVFGTNIVMVDAHISGRQVFNVFRSVSENAWPHLCRETVASDVVKKDPSIFAAFRVMRRLDLEDSKTGFRYLLRFASDVIEREQRKEGSQKDVIER